MIDIRNMWQDGEETRLMPGKENIVYDYQGTVYCHCPETNKRREMAFGGFDGALALMVMSAMAVGRLRQKQGANLRSLVKAA